MIVFEVWRKCEDPCCPVSEHYEGSYSTKDKAQEAINKNNGQFEIKETELDNPIWQL